MTETFRITLDFTESELAAYRRIAQRRQQAPSRAGLTFAILATGISGAFAATILADAGDALRYKGGATVAALSFAMFWLGCWAPAAWLNLLGRRHVRRRVVAWRERWDGAVLSAGSAGIAIRMTGIRMVIAWPAIAAATAEQGLVLLQTALSGVVPIPARLLQPAQRAYLLSRGVGPGLPPPASDGLLAEDPQPQESGE